MLEASALGWRIIQRSALGVIAQIAAGCTFGLAFIVAAFWGVAFAIFPVYGVTLGAALLWFVLVLPLSIGPLLLIAPLIWRCAGWRPNGPFIALRVSSAEVGWFHHYLWLEQEGYFVHVQMIGAGWAIRDALRLAQTASMHTENAP